MMDMTRKEGPRGFVTLEANGQQCVIYKKKPAVGLTVGRSGIDLYSADEIDTAIALLRAAKDEILGVAKSDA